MRKRWPRVKLRWFLREKHLGISLVIFWWSICPTVSVFWFICLSVLSVVSLFTCLARFCFVTFQIFRKATRLMLSWAGDERSRKVAFQNIKRDKNSWRRCKTLLRLRKIRKNSWKLIKIRFVKIKFILVKPYQDDCKTKTFQHSLRHHTNISKFDMILQKLFKIHQNFVETQRYPL